jgi:DNA-binding NtrC family response regulator
MTDHALRKVLVIDDEEKLRTLLSRIISLEGFEVHQAAACKAALKKLEHTDIDIVLCDVKLPDGNGVELSKKIKDAYPLLEIILLTAYGNIPDGVQAIKNGAFDYITKGDDNNKIIPLLNRAIEKVDLAKRVRLLEKQLSDKHSFDKIIGQSKAIQKAIDLARKVAATDTTVLLTGETGTGKEVFAQAIHQASLQAGRSFVALNCSAFSRELLESELFGHRKGAFTGAMQDQKGLIEEANGGTLFLDEIGEMPPELQAKLLRVLETNTYLRVGDTKPSRSNFRLIAATNRDLKQESEAGRFRSDLYFRLNIFNIHLPPLRDRREDIYPIAQHFMAIFADKINKRVTGADDGFRRRLERYAWPGNIRELKNIIERAVILADGHELTLDCLPYDMQPDADHQALSAFSMASAEKLHIQKVLNHTGGNKAEAARLLEIGIATLYRKIEQYQLYSSPSQDL